MSEIKPTGSCRPLGQSKRLAIWLIAIEDQRQSGEPDFDGDAEYLGMYIGVPLGGELGLPIVTHMYGGKIGEEWTETREIYRRQGYAKELLCWLLDNGHTTSIGFPCTPEGEALAASVERARAGRRKRRKARTQ